LRKDLQSAVDVDRVLSAIRDP